MAMKRKKTPKPDLDIIMPLLMGIWRRFHKEAGPPDQLQTREFRRVVKGVTTLIEGLESGKSLIGKDYFSESSLLTSYLLYQWVIHYQQGMSLLNELPYTPQRVLDVCSGPGSFAFAAIKQGAIDVTATDRNELALQLASEACGRAGYPLSIRKWDCLKETIPVSGEFDLIILGHCLEELFPSSSMDWKNQEKLFVEKLLSRLSPQGFLLIVGNTYLEANRRILELRDTLVQSGVPVQAPCVWQGNCPALQVKDSPCFAQREWEKPFLIKEIQRSAKINLGSLKMSYVILRNPTAGWPTLPNKNLYRVISPPIETYQGKHFHLCGTDGKKTLNKRMEIAPAAFKYIQRGDLLSVSEGLEHHQAIDIVEGTTLSIEAPCGKPLPDGYTQS
jgi:SAM-dependent methyltransferase